MLSLVFFAGIITMQIIYLIFNFIFFRKKVFLNYLAFIILVVIFILLNLFPGKPNFISEIPHYLNLKFLLLLFVNGIYFRFLRFAVEAPDLYPLFNRIVRISEYVFYITGLGIFLHLLVMENFGFSKNIGYGVYFGSLFLQLYMMYFLINTKDKLNFLILIGAVSMGILFKVGLIPALFSEGSPDESFKISTLFLIGVTVDFIFFNFVLVFKARRIEREFNRQELKKQKELAAQRLEISNDLHDNVGSILSGLHVYTSILEKSLEQNKELTKTYLNKISTGIVSVMGNMNDVIWAMNIDPMKGKLLSSHLKDFYVDIFEAKNIVCHYDIDKDLEKMITGIKARKNLLLIAKESINNCVKHSDAGQIWISLHQQDQNLKLTIQDDGIGIVEPNLSKGKGLSSLHLRAKLLGGNLSIRNVPGSNGVMIECQVPMTNISDI